MSKTYDIFLSYAHSDKDAVLPLRDALRAAGLEVWFDESAVESFSAVSHTVGEGLAVCKALLAFYSRTYPTRRACQWELTAAFIAAQRLGEPSRRILVVNPEPDSRDHIQPAALRDTLLPPFPAPDDAAGFRALAESVRERVAALQEALGDVGPMVQPRWHPIAAIGSPRFVGRVPDLWAIHSTLHAAEYPLTTGQYTRVVFVSGFGGIGKTLLAEEYALRFGAAYPGGVFWLRAFGGDPERADLGPEMREAERDRQIREIARSLGLSVEDLPLTQVRGMIAGALERAGKPALWVVDDLPEGFSSDDVRAWLAPHPFAATLVTTRSREYSGLGIVLQPGVLPVDEAYALLTFQRKPTGAEEEQAARNIVAELGSHALALEIAGASLNDSHDRSFVEFLTDLRDPSYDELALAAELAPVLPTERKEGIAAMLARSIAGLSDDARKVLVIASMLPPSPIPDAILIGTVAQTTGTPDREAKHRARRALAETDRRSLTERVGEHARTVHPLLLRTARFSEEFERASAQLRQALVRSLHHEINRLKTSPVGDPGSAALTHAHALIQTLKDDAEAFLASELSDYSRYAGRYDDAVEIRSKLVEYSRGRWGSEAALTLMSLDSFIADLSHQGDTHRAQLIAEELWAIRKRKLGEQDPATLGVMSNLAILMYQQGKFRDAISLNKEVLEIRTRTLGPEHPDTLDSIENLAVCTNAQGDRAGARKLFHSVLEIRRRVLGEEHRTTLRSMANLSACLAENGDTAAARALGEQVLELNRRVMGNEHPETLRVMSNLANLIARSGDYSTAKALDEQVLEIRRHISGNDHFETIQAEGNLALRLNLSGDTVGARALTEQVLRTARRVLGSDHPYTLMMLHNLAIHEHNAGEPERARETARAALAGRLRVLGAEHPSTIATQRVFDLLSGVLPSS